jgi:hypothetical protein
VEEETDMSKPEKPPEDDQEGEGKKTRQGAKKTREKPVSLHPLSFEDAVRGLLQVLPEQQGAASAGRNAKKTRA